MDRWPLAVTPWPRSLPDCSGKLDSSASVLISNFRSSNQSQGPEREYLPCCPVYPVHSPTSPKDSWSPQIDFSIKKKKIHMTTAISEEILTVLGGQVGCRFLQQSVKSAGLTAVQGLRILVDFKHTPLSKSLRAKLQLPTTTAFFANFFWCFKNFSFYIFWCHSISHGRRITELWFIAFMIYMIYILRQNKTIFLALF